MMLHLFSFNYCSNRAAIPLYHCIYFLNPFVLFLGKGSERQYSFQQDLSGNIKDLQRINPIDALRNLLHKDIYWTKNGTYPQGFFSLIPFDGAEISIFDTRFKGDYAFRYLNIGFNSFDGLYLSSSVYRILWSREEIVFDSSQLHDESNLSQLRFLNPFNFFSVSLGVKFKLCRVHEFFVSLYTDNDDHKIRRFPNYHRFLFGKDISRYHRNLSMINHFKDYSKLKERQATLRLKIKILSDNDKSDYESIRSELRKELMRDKIDEIGSKEFDKFLEDRIDTLAWKWSNGVNDRESIVREYEILSQDSQLFVERVDQDRSINDRERKDFISSLNDENRRIRNEYSIPDDSDSSEDSDRNNIKKIRIETSEISVQGKDGDDIVRSTGATFTDNKEVSNVENYTDSISIVRSDLVKDNMGKSIPYNALSRAASSAAMISMNYGKRASGNITGIVEQYGHNTELSPKQVRERREIKSMEEHRTYSASAHRSLESTIGAYRWFLMVFELKQSLDNVLWGFVTHLIHFDLALNMAFSIGESSHDLVLELTWSPIKTLISYIRRDTLYFNLEVNFDYGNRMIRSKNYSPMESLPRDGRIRNLRDLRNMILGYIMIFRRFLFNLRILANRMRSNAQRKV